MGHQAKLRIKNTNEKCLKSLTVFIFFRGLLPTNKIGFPKLVDDQAYMHQLFAIGNVGSVALLVRAYQTLTWTDSDFRVKNKVWSLHTIK